jgi:hypothetical protein
VPGEESGLWSDAACKAQPPTAPFFGVSPVARHEHLPIYKAALDMAVHFAGLVVGFSRHHKYTLGTELRQGGRAVLQQVLHSNNASDKVEGSAGLLALRDRIEALAGHVRRVLSARSRAGRG